jgi:hypothetical protein
MLHPTDSEMAVHYQQDAWHYNLLQANYRRRGDNRQAVRAQRNGLIATETAMDYLQRLLERE